MSDPGTPDSPFIADQDCFIQRTVKPGNTIQFVVDDVTPPSASAPWRVKWLPKEGSISDFYIVGIGRSDKTDLKFRNVNIVNNRLVATFKRGTGSGDYILVVYDVSTSQLHFPIGKGDKDKDRIGVDEPNPRPKIKVGP